MLFPWEIARFRNEVRKNPAIENFEGYGVRRLIPQLAGSQGFGIEIRPGSSAAFRPPDCIFGRPEITTCLDDVVSSERPLPASQIFTIPNATIIGTIAALSAEGFLFCDGPARSDADMVRFHAQNLSNAHGFVLERVEEDFAVHFLSTPNDQKIQGRTIFLTSQEIGNFGCFLYWTLPQMILLAENFREPVDQYVVTDRAPWVYEALEILGFPTRPVYKIEEVCGAKFESLTMTNVLSPEGFFHSTFSEAFLRMARKVRISFGKDHVAKRKIYVSRLLSAARSPNYRALINEARIQQSFVQKGFDAIAPETLSFRDQIRVFDSARIVAGPSGSGMLNSIFAPPGAVIVDFESYHVTVRQHARIYSSTQKAYSFCFGRFDANDARPDQTMRRWYLDERDVSESRAWAESAAANC